MAFAYLTWFNIPAALMVPAGDLAAWAARVNIPANFLPAPPNPIDAFRTSTSNFMAGHKVDDGFVSYVIREHQNEKIYISRRMERLKYDQKGLITGQDPEVALFILLKATGQLQVRVNERTEEDDNLVREIQERFTYLCSHHGHKAVRGMVNRYLASLAAVKINNFGVLYFVPGQFGEQLAELQQLLQGIGAGGGLIEMQDTESVRQIARNSIYGTLQRALENYRPPKKPGTTKLPARYLLRVLGVYRELLGDPLVDLQPMIDDLTRKFQEEVANF